MARSLDWAAGMFEGEGCVCVGRRQVGNFHSEAARLTISLSLTSTDKDVIDEFAAVMGIGYISERPWHRRNGHKPSWRWSTKNLVEVVTGIGMLQPLMGERRRAKMDEALAAVELKRQRRAEIGRELHFGPRKKAT